MNKFHSWSLPSCHLKSRENGRWRWYVKHEQYHRKQLPPSCFPLTTTAPFSSLLVHGHAAACVDEQKQVLETPASPSALNSHAIRRPLFPSFAPPPMSLMRWQIKFATAAPSLLNSSCTQLCLILASRLSLLTFILAAGLSCAPVSCHGHASSFHRGCPHLLLLVHSLRASSTRVDDLQPSSPHVVPPQPLLWLSSPPEHHCNSCHQCDHRWSA